MKSLVGAHRDSVSFNAKGTDWSTMIYKTDESIFNALTKKHTITVYGNAPVNRRVEIVLPQDPACFGVKCVKGAVERAYRSGEQDPICNAHWPCWEIANCARGGCGP